MKRKLTKIMARALIGLLVLSMLLALVLPLIR